VDVFRTLDYKRMAPGVVPGADSVRERLAVDLL